MIKRILLAGFLLLWALPALAGNYFTLGENDTLLISPIEVERYETIPVNAHFDGRVDYWYVSFSVPSEFAFVSVSPRSGMTVHYVNSAGVSTFYEALLTHNTIDAIAVSSYIPITGYWDYDSNGILEPYGTVKWEAGDYNPLFAITFRIPSCFTEGEITLTGNVSAGPDDRGGTVQSFPPSTFSRTVTVKVGYRRGDVNGDGRVSMDDLSTLSSYLTGSVELDGYQMEAADVDGNGLVDMDDHSALINYLLTGGTLSQDELEQILGGGTQMS